MPRNNAGIPAIVTSMENSKSVRRNGKKTARPPVRVPIAVRAKAKRGMSGTDRRIYDSVSNAVMSQRLPPGTKLTESTFCELFKVSRTIVRKALQRLEHEHIIELRPNRGAIVARPTPQETREIFIARRAVEAAILPPAGAGAAPPPPPPLRPT